MIQPIALTLQPVPQPAQAKRLEIQATRTPSVDRAPDAQAFEQRLRERSEPGSSTPNGGSPQEASSEGPADPGASETPAGEAGEAVDTKPDETAPTEGSRPEPVERPEDAGDDAGSTQGASAAAPVVFSPIAVVEPVEVQAARTQVRGEEALFGRVKGEGGSRPSLGGVGRGALSETVRAETNERGAVGVDTRGRMTERGAQEPAPATQATVQRVTTDGSSSEAQPDQPEPADERASLERPAVEATPKRGSQNDGGSDTRDARAVVAPLASDRGPSSGDDDPGQRREPGARDPVAGFARKTEAGADGEKIGAPAHQASSQRPEQSRHEPAPRAPSAPTPDAGAGGRVTIEQAAPAKIEASVSSAPRNEGGPTLAGARGEGTPTVEAQVSRGVGAALSQRGGSITLKLAPESLGHVKVSLRVDRGDVTLDLEATTEQAHRALTKELGALRASLESRGLRVEKAQVHLAPAPVHTNSADQAGARQQAGDPQHDARDEARDDTHRGGHEQRRERRSDDQQAFERFAHAWDAERIALGVNAQA
ncbi:MAG: hypothetical protein Tsb0013_16130 [Phycisphaerales bacterium]